MKDMLIRYKTIVEEGQELYELKTIDFCCLEAKEAWDNRILVFNKHSEQNHSLNIYGENKDYKMIYLKINYCPFCKSEIKTEEIEKVKVVRKIKKEVIEIDRVFFEEVKIWSKI